MGLEEGTATQEGGAMSTVCLSYESVPPVQDYCPPACMKTLQVVGSRYIADGQMKFVRTFFIVFTLNPRLQTDICSMSWVGVIKWTKGWKK